MVSTLTVCLEEKIQEKFRTWAENQENLKVSHVNSYGDALAFLSTETVDLLVTNEQLDKFNGFDLVKGIISYNPMLNCAITSDLEPDTFHEKSEGLGVLTQLPIDTKYADIEDLFKKLENVMMVT